MENERTIENRLVMTEQRGGKKMSLFRKLDLFRNILSILFYMAMVTFNLMSNKGHPVINKALLGITFGYLLFFIIITMCEFKDKNNKEIRKTGTKVYKIMKKCMLLISALMTAGMIFSVSGETRWVKLLGTIFTIANLSLQIFFSIVMSFAAKRMRAAAEHAKANARANIQELKNGFKVKHSADTELATSEQETAETESKSIFKNKFRK